MTLIHGQGVAQMKVRFCACPENDTKIPIPDTSQLLRFGLFPGSWDVPRSAFTTNGLRDYHLLSLQCQITGLDYMRFLQRSTDNVEPVETKVNIAYYATLRLSADIVPYRIEVAN